MGWHEFVIKNYNLNNAPYGIERDEYMFFGGYKINNAHK